MPRQVNGNGKHADVVKKITEDPEENSIAAAATNADAIKRSSSKDNDLFAIRKIHREVIDLLDTIKKQSSGHRQDIVQRLLTRWVQHSLLEEEFLLPEIISHNMLAGEFMEGEIKRDLVKVLIANLNVEKIDQPEETAKLCVLDTFMRQLVEAEEKPNTGLFACIEALNVPNLGSKISHRKEDLEQDDVPNLVLSHLSVQSLQNNTYEKENVMSYRERDELGRFVSEDDHRGGSHGRRMDDRSERRHSRSDYDERHHNSGRSSSSRDYDDNRRSSSDDHRRSSSYGRSRNDDQRRYGRQSDEGYGRDHGQGGWFGDSEGHAEAARRGWDERRSSGRDYDDDRRSSSRSYDRSHDDDHRRHGRQNDEGYGRDHGQGGWFGDSEGHAEAARRGWDERRSSGRDHDDGRRSRSYHS